MKEIQMEIKEILEESRQVQNPEGQLPRWKERLQQYNLKIEHRKGIHHSNADALARRLCPVDCKHCSRRECQDVGEVKLCHTTVELDGNWDSQTWKKEQQDDEDIGQFLEWKQSGIPRAGWNQVSNQCPAMKSYLSQSDSLVVDEGLLKRMWVSSDG